VLKAAHALTFDVGRTGGEDEALLGHVLCGGGLPVIAAVVDDDFEAVAEVLEPGDDFGLVEIVGDDANLRQGIGDGLIEEVENVAARFETHPVKGFGGFGMRGSEAKALLGFRRKQGCEGLISIIAAIAIYEGLGDDKAAGEGDIELSGDRFRDGVRSLPPETRHS